jgi:Fis family transcriptional regulator
LVCRHAWSLDFNQPRNGLYESASLRFITTTKQQQNNNKWREKMIPSLNNSENLFVANLQNVSLEKLVQSKLEVLFSQQQEAQVELNGLYNVVLEQVERPLIEIALKNYNGNQVKTAQLLGINRNTLKKKIDNYKIKVKRNSMV